MKSQTSNNQNEEFEKCTFFKNKHYNGNKAATINNPSIMKSGNILVISI